MQTFLMQITNKGDSSSAGLFYPATLNPGVSDSVRYQSEIEVNNLSNLVRTRHDAAATFALGKV
jgi:hypothetical protein